VSAVKRSDNASRYSTPSYGSHNYNQNLSNIHLTGLNETKDAIMDGADDKEMKDLVGLQEVAKAELIFEVKSSKTHSLRKEYSKKKQLPSTASNKKRLLLTALFILIFVSKGSAQLVGPSKSKYLSPIVNSTIDSKTEVIPPMCKSPYLNAPEVAAILKRATFALSDTTSPSPPDSLQVFRENIHSIFARWKAASDPESGIDYYAFAFGSTPGEADIEWWQSTGLNLRSYSKSMNELGLNEGDTIYFSVRATNKAGLQSEIVSSGPIVLEYEPLGEDSNAVSVDFAGEWSQDELDDLQWFLNRMVPIIKEIYGPPSHSYTVTLVKDSIYSSSAIFFPSSNEIHMDGLHPQLLTHEIIHAFRDNVILSSDDNWNYDPTLSGFEESFAQGMSYVCMNRYVDLYPADLIVPGNTIYGSSYDWDYDYHNTDILTTTDFWSDYGGTGVYWLRYEMGAAAIIKILKNYPNFAYDFNREYYARLNADNALTTSRELMRQIISGVAPLIEGRETNEWIDRQHIFDCFIRTGRKIWVRTQHYPSREYLVFQTVYYYETFSNGSEWAYWDTVSGSWGYHNLNGSTGYGVLRNWNGDILWEKDLLIEPTENPPDYFGFGNEVIHLSTANDTSPWPGGDSTDFILNLNDFGLYRLALSFGSDTTQVIRIMGDSLRNTTGVFGAVLNTTSGMIYLNHENLPDEPPIPVVNGVFKGERDWASIPNSSTGYEDSQPGRVLATYIDDNGNVFKDQRNIDLGSWSGNQLFLFDTQAMTSVVTRIHAKGNGVPKEFALRQNYPNPFNPITKIWYELPNHTKVSLKVYDLLGREVAVLVDEEKQAGRYEVDWEPREISSGVYFYRLQASEFVQTRRLILLK